MMTAPQPPESLLHTKLMIPRLHASLIPRAELWARLDQGLSRKLTLVTAPTGFGKTTLVSQWLAERGIPAAWVTLDENDNDPVRFWTYTITALRTFDPAIGKTALAALMASQPAGFQFQSILTPLINDLSRISTASVLVLEDFHVIHSLEIKDGVEFLLQHLPSPLHLVLVARTEPDLPLGILRVRDELLEVDAASLRFSLAETEQFLRQALKLEISSQALVKLQERTEGWAAGLRLAALSLQKGSALDAEQVIQSFSGSHRYVADYLIREVFESQPEARRDFLLKTCFLDRLTGSLCDAVTGAHDGETVLEQLEREGLFVARLEHGRGRAWYRYNPLFAESIQYLARQRLDEAGIQSVLEKASTWFEYQQLNEDAIEMSLAARQYERTLELVERFTKMNNINELVTLSRWLDQIPTPLILRFPEICLAYAQVILFRSDRYAPATAAAIEPYLQAAEETWQAQGNEGRVGAVLAARGMLLLWQGDYPLAFDYVYQSLEKLPEHDIYWRGISLLNAAAGELQAGRIASAQDRIIEGRALLGASQNVYGALAATQLLGEVFYWQGNHEQAKQTCYQIMAEAVGDESMLDDQGLAAMGLANVAYELNDLEAAEQHARQALELARQRSNVSLEAQATARLALVDAARGAFSQAQEQLKIAVAALPKGAVLREMQCVQAQVALMAGKAEGLGWWRTLVTGEKHRLLPVQREREVFTLARLYLAEGKPDEARGLLDRWQTEAAQHGRVRSQVEAGCIEALAFQAGGNPIQAAQTLAQVLAAAEEKRFCRLIVDYGAPMASLLRQAIPLLTHRPSLLYATTLLHSFAPGVVSAPETAPGGRVLVEPLSQQEVRVLRLLAAGLSNADIARELVVSTNTIKTHVKSIYRKLDINSRSEARMMVKELKLV